MLTCDFVLQAALKRLAFPAEAQECIWRVSDILLVSLPERTSPNVTIFFFSGMIISIFSQVLASVLHLGNIHFNALEKEGTEVMVIFVLFTVLARSWLLWSTKVSNNCEFVGNREGHPWNAGEALRSSCLGGLAKINNGDYVDDEWWCWIWWGRLVIVEAPVS